MPPRTQGLTSLLHEIRACTRRDTGAGARSALAPGQGGLRRCFVAIWPDEGARDALLALAEQCARGQPRAEPVGRSNLHLTLAFIGPLDERAGEQLADAIGRLRERSGEFVLERVGFFAKSRVLWAGTGPSPSLEALARTVRDLLSVMSVPFDAKRFSPHVTLLRHASNLPGPAPQIRIPWPNSVPDLVVSERDPNGSLIYRPWRSKAPGQ